MAQGYKCRKCGWTVTVGVPQVRITQEVSAVLAAETARPITFHDLGPHAATWELHQRGEESWSQKVEEYYKASHNLRRVPDSCPGCGAANWWDVTLALE